MKHPSMDEFSPLSAFQFGTGRKRAAATPPSAENDTELALAKARGKARAEGFEEGVLQTEARIDREVQDTLAAIAAAVEIARADRADLERSLAGVARRIVLVYLKRISPRLAETALADQIAETVAEALSGPSGAELRVRVAPNRAEEIAERIQAADLGVVVEADPAIDPARAEAAWSGGFDDIDIGALADRALAILDAGLSAAETHDPSAENMERQ